MARYLITTCETFRVDSEAECEQIINDAKQDSTFELTKYNCEAKDVKVKGEVVDTFFKVTLTKNFTDMKEPAFQTEITYEVV